MTTPFEIQLLLPILFIVLSATFYLAISQLSRDYESIKQNPWFSSHKGLKATNVLFYSRKNRYLLASILGLLGFFVGLRIGGSLSGGLLGGFICYALPQVTIKHSSWRHRNKLERQLAVVLQGIADSMKAGQTVFEALQRAAQSAPEGVKQELFVVASQVKAGISLEKVLEEWETRIQRPRTSAAIRILCGAIKAHGNLADAFEQAANMIVQHTRLEVEHKIALIQMRMRALLLSLIPLVFLLGIYLTNSSYLQPLLTSQLGWGLLATIGIMQWFSYKLIVKQTTF